MGRPKGGHWVTLCPGPPHPAVTLRKPGLKASGAYPAWMSILQTGRLRLHTGVGRAGSPLQGCPSEWRKAANAKVLLGAGHLTTLRPGQPHQSEFPPMKTPRPKEGMTCPGCRVGLRSEPSSDPEATHLTLSLLLLLSNY